MGDGVGLLLCGVGWHKGWWRGCGRRVHGTRFHTLRLSGRCSCVAAHPPFLLHLPSRVLQQLLLIIISRAPSDTTLLDRCICSCAVLGSDSAYGPAVCKCFPLSIALSSMTAAEVACVLAMRLPYAGVVTLVAGHPTHAAVAVWRAAAPSGRLHNAPMRIRVRLCRTGQGSVRRHAVSAGPWRTRQLISGTN